MMKKKLKSIALKLWVFLVYVAVYAEKHPLAAKVVLYIIKLLVLILAIVKLVLKKIM